MHGRKYDASDASLLLWVHATLIDSARRAFELLVRSLEAAEYEQLYQESKRVKRSVGIPESQIPSDSRAFDAYVRTTMEGTALSVTPAAIDQWAFLRKQKPSTLIEGVFLRSPSSKCRAIADHPFFRHASERTLHLLAMGMLPARVRAAYGCSWGLQERAEFATLVATLRAAYRTLPGRLRFHRDYRKATARLAAFARSSSSFAHDSMS